MTYIFQLTIKGEEEFNTEYTILSSAVASESLMNV